MKGVEQAFTLRGLATQDQLQQLQLNQAKTAMSDQSRSREIISRGDITTPKGLVSIAGELAHAGLSQQAMDILREGDERQQRALALQNVASQLTESQLRSTEALSNVMAPFAQSLIDTLDAKGPDQTRAQFAAGLPALLQGIPEGMRSQVLGALEPGGRLPQDPEKLRQMLKGVVQSGTVGRQLLEIARQNREDAETRRHHLAEEAAAQQRINFQRDKSGGLTQQSVDSAAEQYMAGDKGAVAGLSPKDRVQIRNRVADLQQIRGLTGADQAAANAQFAGVQAGERTLSNRQANIDMAVQEAQNIEPIVRKASQEVSRGAYTSWNGIMQAYEKGTSDPKLYAFLQAAKSFANIYTRATVPGASSVTDRQDALEHLPVFTDDKSFQAVLDIMDQEMEQAKRSPGQVRQDMARAITNRAEPPSPGQRQNPGPPPQGSASVAPLGSRPPTVPPEAGAAAKPPAPAGITPAPAGALAKLKAHPELAEAFKAKYGYLPQ
jgi:hypothetical protein